MNTGMKPLRKIDTGQVRKERRHSPAPVRVLCTKELHADEEQKETQSDSSMASKREGT